MTWTHFNDMHSGGGTKVGEYEHILIEQDQTEAVETFRNTFNRDPHHVSCDCCGADYSVDESPSLKQATGHERNCRHLKTPKDENGLYKNNMPGLRENYYLEPEEEPPEGFEVDDSWPVYGDHIPLDEYVKRDDVLAIRKGMIDGNTLQAEIEALRQ